MPKSKAFRKKMGRPITVPGGSPVTVKLAAELLKRLDAYASKRAVDRSAAMRQLIERGLTKN
jgi:hypothetical protein